MARGIYKEINAAVKASELDNLGKKKTFRDKWSHCGRSRRCVKSPRDRLRFDRRFWNFAHDNVSDVLYEFFFLSHKYIEKIRCQGNFWQNRFAILA